MLAPSNPALCARAEGPGRGTARPGDMYEGVGRNMTWTRAMASLFAALAAVAGAGAAHAAQPAAWQLGLQQPATVVAGDIGSFHNLLLIIITVITVFVLALLVYVMVRFRADKNPVPSKTAHNTVIEVIWTVVPVMILIVIAIPSFKLLYLEDVVPKADMTIKAIGHQWFWSYEYPDHGNFTFDALMVSDEDLKAGQPRLLETDNRVVVPVNTTVRLQTTADDVIHSWTIPAFGLKKDAVPGRLNEGWFRVEREGVYYGQCSELCGSNHGFMPIAVEVVSKEAFAKWVEEAKKKFARVDEPAVNVAARAVDTRQ
jgi:cytochrome c oxidase subunit 2